MALDYGTGTPIVKHNVQPNGQLFKFIRLIFARQGRKEPARRHESTPHKFRQSSLPYDIYSYYSENVQLQDAELPVVYPATVSNTANG